MMMKFHDLDEQHWILVEGPESGDAEFAARWLQLAVKADRLLRHFVFTDPDFRPPIDIASFAVFAPAAMAFIAMWLADESTFKMDLPKTGLAEIFVTMTDVGFFTQTGDRYQMTIPKTPRIKEITASLLKLAATEDAERYHPEWLVATMTNKAASDWQRRLSGLGSMQRVADRNALLA
jgi:hypothetical protein